MTKRIGNALPPGGASAPDTESANAKTREFPGREEEPDLLCGRLGCIRAVRGVALDVGAEILADRARLGLRGIG